MANVFGAGASSRQLLLSYETASLPPTTVIALALEPTIPLRTRSLKRPIPYVSILSFREMCPEVT